MRARSRRCATRWDRRIHHQVRKERWKEEEEQGRETKLGIGKVFGTRSIVLVHRANVDVCANVADNQGIRFWFDSRWNRRFPMCQNPAWVFVRGGVLGASLRLRVHKHLSMCQWDA